MSAWGSKVSIEIDLSDIDDDDLIEYVRKGFGVEEVYDLEAIIDAVRDSCDPEGVFSKADLEAWADDNGLTYEEGS